MMCLEKKSPFSCGWRQQNSRKHWISFARVNLGGFFLFLFFFLTVYFLVHRKQREFWWSQPYQPHTGLQSTICECANTSNPVCASGGSLLLPSQGWLPAQEGISKSLNVSPAQITPWQPSEILLCTVIPLDLEEFSVSANANVPVLVTPSVMAPQGGVPQGLYSSYTAAHNLRLHSRQGVKFHSSEAPLNSYVCL